MLFGVVLACYIILSAGLQCAPTLGDCANADNINTALLNLSYSFLAGFIFFLLTSALPHYQKVHKFRPLIDQKEEHIIEKLVSCMKSVFPVEKKKGDSPFNKWSVIRLFSETDLESPCHLSHFICAAKDMSVLDYLVAQRNSIKELIDEILNYKEFMAAHELSILEQIRSSYFFMEIDLFIREDLNEPNNRKTLANFLVDVTDTALSLSRVK